MSEINVNMVMQYSIEENADKRIRIIWIDEFRKFAYVVYLNGEGSMPIPIELEQLEYEIECGKLIETGDPYLKLIDEEQLPQKLKSIRDEAWQVVQMLWDKPEPDILSKDYRAKCIKEVSQTFNLPEYTVKRIIKRFWQRGMTKNSLIPEYSNSGAPGKIRGVTDKKRGRPKAIGLNGKVTVGINITENIRRIFEMSIKQFFRNSKKPSLRETYDSMLQKYFSNKVTHNDQTKIQVWDSSRIPTYHQFYYWFSKYRDPKKDFISRNSETKFNLQMRELLGNSNMEVYGPGSKYQVDATPADIYIVSKVHPHRIIGRPVVYAVIDVYSRMVVGIFVGLEGPSWIGAMMALDNIVADKVEFCKKYGIEITEDMWPNSFLPETILADRGEFEGYSVENLINNLKVTVENTPAYRGDLKGIVERYFRTTNERIKHKAPGAIEKEFRERGDRDYRLDATLNLDEFTQIIIEQVLWHNNNVKERFQMEKEMIVAEIPPKPVAMWKWGIANRKGRFNKYPTDIVRLNLLPRAKASISREGICFKGMYYSSQKAIEEQWFIKLNRSYSDIVYDPRNINYIYIPDEKGRQFVKCFMLEKSYDYKDLQIEEIVFLEELKREIIVDSTDDNNQNRANMDTAVEKIISKAQKRKSSQNIKETKKTRLSNIKENRSEERARLRTEQAFELDEKEMESLMPVDIGKSDKSNILNSNEPVNNTISILRRKRDEKLGPK